MDQVIHKQMHLFICKCTNTSFFKLNFFHLIHNDLKQSSQKYLNVFLYVLHLWKNAAEHVKNIKKTHFFTEVGLLKKSKSKVIQEPNMHFQVCFAASRTQAKVHCYSFIVQSRH